MFAHAWCCRRQHNWTETKAIEQWKLQWKKAGRDCEWMSSLPCECWLEGAAHRPESPRSTNQQASGLLGEVEPAGHFSQSAVRDSRQAVKIWGRFCHWPCAARQAHSSTRDESRSGLWTLDFCMQLDFLPAPQSVSGASTPHSASLCLRCRSLLTKELVLCHKR